MIENRQIRKVKYNDSKVIIEYQVERDGGCDKYTMECSDAPTQDFIDALDNLKILTKGWTGGLIECGDDCRVAGASMSHKNGVFGGCFCVLKPIAGCGAPLVLNMPHKPSVPYSEGGDEDVCLTGTEFDALQEVHNQALAYLDGERAQMELELSEGVEK